MPTYELLYISELSPETPPTSIADILTQARQVNKAKGITGLLLFDGQHFIQVLEGSREDVLEAMERIENDQRHCRVKRLHESFIRQRQFQSFGVGYWYVEDESRALTLGKLRGRAAMAELRAHRVEFDVKSDGPLFAVPNAKSEGLSMRYASMAYL